jgi:hypothetical protein
MPALSFDLSRVDLSKRGFWFCCGCYRVTEPIAIKRETDYGCKLCQSPNIKWCPPLVTVDPAERRALTRPPNQTTEQTTTKFP